MDPRLNESVRRARSGDPRAFRTLADILGPELIRFLTLLLNGDDHAAHDVAQEVFLCAWDGREQFESGEHLRRWSFRVARCRAVSWLRARRPPGRQVESLDIVGESGRRRGDVYAVDPSPGRDSAEHAVATALRRLPPRYAGAVHLYYVQGYSTQEAADLLGLKRSALKMRLLRARTYLRRQLHRHPALAPRSSDPVGDTTP